MQFIGLRYASVLLKYSIIAAAYYCVYLNYIFTEGLVNEYGLSDGHLSTSRTKSEPVNYKALSAPRVGCGLWSRGMGGASKSRK